MSALNKKQVSELITALKRGEIPLKLEYLGKGAKYYLNFSKIAMYKTEAMLIKNNSPSILSSVGNVNFVYTGCGNGYKIVPLIEASVKKFGEANVFLLDISRYMLRVAKRNLRNFFKKRINVETHILDFESGNFAFLTRSFRRKTGKNNLLILIGNTLGNLSERKRILTNFRESMTLSDYLLLGLHLRSKTIIDRIKAFGKRKVVFDFVQTRLDEIARGSFSTKIRWNPKTKNIEFRAAFKRNVELNYRGEKLGFKKGDSLLICTVHLFSLQEIHQLIENSGFEIERKFIDENQEEIVILCRPISF
jgi:uncharacterized SAM-dependent methyltransferase